MQERRVHALEKEVRSLHARLDSAHRTIKKMTCERDAARHEAQEERIRHQDTKRILNSLREAVEHLDERFKALLRRQYGAASEQFNGNQMYITECLDALDPDTRDVLQDLGDCMALLGTDESTDSTAAIEQDSNGNALLVHPDKKRQRPAKSGGRRPLPDDLERVHVTYTPPENHPLLINAIASEVIATKTCERVIVPKIQVLVEVTTCQVLNITYAPGVTVRATMTPPAVIDGGQVGDSFLIQSACDKVMDHLPAYRQNQRWAPQGFDVARSKLCRWHIQLGQFLQPVADAIFHELHRESFLGIDDTVHRLLVPNHGSCKHGRLWAIAGDAGLFYQFHETREGKWIDGLLQDYSGGIMGDAFSGHNALLRRDGIMALFCWAHVRRKFYDAAASTERTHMLRLIAALYALESETVAVSAEERLRIRNEKARPLLKTIRTALDTWDANPRILPKSGIGRAVTYALKLWDGLTNYTTHHQAPIDNNHTERGMRKNALHRKNSLFSASVAGAEAYATMLTVMQSAHLQGLNIRAYLADIIDDLHHQRRPVSDLTPTQYVNRLPEAVKIRS